MNHQQQMFTASIYGFWGAFLAAAVFSVPILRLLNALKSRQTVSQHAPEGHQAKQGTPTMGGLIILVGILVGGLVSGELVKQWAIFLVIFLFAVIGFVDDFVVPRLMPGKRGLGWKQKISMQVVGAAIPMYFLSGGNWIHLALGVFSILFFSNAFNFVDGLDGLAGGVLLAMLFGLPGALACLNHQFSFSGTVMTIAGATIPFLYWNAPKAKVFMGDVGSLAIGAFFGISLVATKAQAPVDPVLGTLGLLAWSFLMIAELVPVPLQVASVKLRKKKIFPYTPIHHAFEKAGWPETRVVFVFILVQILGSMIAIHISIWQNISTWQSLTK
jgi:phospho-N-acetylmuramoyl-pentapeptide-transferase